MAYRSNYLLFSNRNQEFFQTHLFTFLQKTKRFLTKNGALAGKLCFPAFFIKTKRVPLSFDWEPL
ncbi:MAG: hypothetical protein COU82_02100 [Candidatus Portnoybacteria bacterium CG10_big_fil_rev_8_21_14_0_10_38_18]|uniref:Uncharacterized protein n=1 Tax=Candidatus Portnoybacteria bacterium CG10_big_fil_rev_8_21_14_0_10_38_18 TaxID=1974813 RepID=A0A2M8KBX2_9BACT|nr:MAG: hypothetical protein COU82_02100 [Candidatus Portnoybacteria bacterium CG10_big_fil_rev_8_21_14_0_10_38_18]